MSRAAVVGNDAVMTGERQVVQLDVGTKDDALADGIDCPGVVERLGESRAITVAAADFPVPVVCRCCRCRRYCHRSGS